MLHDAQKHAVGGHGHVTSLQTNSLENDVTHEKNHVRGFGVRRSEGGCERTENCLLS